MMSPDSLVRRARRWKAAYAAGLCTGMSFLLFLAGGAALLLLDWVRPLSQDARQALWAAALAGALGAVLRRLRAWEGWGLRRVALEAGRSLRPSDGLLNGWELLKRPPPEDQASPELIRLSLLRLEEQLKGLDVGRAMRPPRWAFWAPLSGGALLLSLSAFALLPPSGRSFLSRAYFPFGADLVRGVASVAPGDARFPWGESVAVEVALSQPGGEPELWVRSSAFQWERRSLESAGSGRFRYVFQELLEPVSYKVRFRGQWTPSYELTPFRPPAFRSLRAELRPPAYTGRPTEVLENVYAFRALRGSQLVLRGRLDQEVSRASAAFEDGRALPVKLERGTDVLLSLDAYEPGLFRLKLEAPGLPASGANGIEFQLEVDEDRPPLVRILAPAQDLLVSPREKLPVAYEVSDDFGVSEVFLHYRVNDGDEKKVSWERLARGALPTDGEVFDKVWSLESLNLRPGDAVRYYLSARDNNALAGPSEGRSAAFTVQVASYEREHELLEEGLAEFRKKLLDILAGQSLAREELNEPEPDWSDLQRKQAALRRDLEAQADRLGSLMAKMEKDPLTDQVAAAEHAAIRDNLRDLAQDAMPRAEGGLAARDKEPAARAMDEALAELERLSLLSEDAQQAGRMRDLLSAQDELSQAARSLADGVEAAQGRSLSPEERRRFQELMDEMSRLMGRIADQIQKMPQELPEDFVNQESVKSIRFDEVQSLMKEMQDALARGDSAAAMAAAQQMLQRLRDIQGTLQKAGQQTAGGPDWFGGALMEEMSKRQGELKSLVERQEALKARAQAHSDKALSRRLEAQKALLAKLAAEQQRLMDSIEKMQEGLSRSGDARLAAEGRMRAFRALDLMKRVRDEFAGLKVARAPQLLEEIDLQLQALAAAAAQSRERASARSPAPSAGAAPAEPADPSADIEKAALSAREDVRRLSDRLGEAPPDADYLTGEEKGDAVRSSGDQAALRTDTLAFRRAVQELSRKTATLSGRLSRRLQSAADAMDGAATALAAADLRPALEDQEQALQHLREGQEEMQSAAQNMSGMGGAAGRPMAGSVQSLSGGGASGSRSAPVRIPRADEYRPPREFREDILKSMKEKYPKAYEKIIQDYYKNWAK